MHGAENFGQPEQLVVIGLGIGRSGMRGCAGREAHCRHGQNDEPRFAIKYAACHPDSRPIFEVMPSGTEKPINTDSGHRHGARSHVTIKDRLEVCHVFALQSDVAA